MNNKPESFSDYLYRQIYVLSAITAVIVIFAGFAHSYFLRGIFAPTVNMRTLVHVHGFVMTLWFSLFLVQSFLIRKNNIALHRRLGILGAVLAATIIVTGPLTAITSFRLSGGPPQFMSVALFEIVIFTIMVSMGLAMRQRKDYHKRFMVLATLGILTSAIARIPVDTQAPLQLVDKLGLPAAFGINDLIILTVIVFDTIKNRRLHPAYGWGLLLIVGLQVFRIVILTEQWWIGFANWLVH